jgi:Txe/YoeB family toxin of Txe-Axe toxin-antitoxin module
MWAENARADSNSDAKAITGAEKIRDLIKETKNTPFRGRGKPSL